MIVSTVADLKGTKGDARMKHWSSLRFLHRDDGMGFTIIHTVLEAGTGQIVWYKNPLEACYCLAQQGPGLRERPHALSSRNNGLPSYAASLTRGPTRGEAAWRVLQAGSPRHSGA